MRTLTFFTLLLLHTFFVRAQIKNSNFEIAMDTLPSMPQHWGVKKIDGYSYFLDNIIKYSGLNSFALKSIQLNDTIKFIPFSQLVEINVRSVKKITISTYIRNENINGNVGLWCQIWDKDNRKIGFGNLAMQKTLIMGSMDWKKYSINLLVDKRAKKLLLGGYLQGMGSVWFDDFTVEDSNIDINPPSKNIKKHIREIKKNVKRNSIFSDSINWKNINADIYLLSLGLKTNEDLQIISDYFLSKLREVGDNHSHFLNSQIAEKSNIQNIDGRQPSAKLIEGNIGYIYVPGFESQSDTISLNFATKIQSLIKDLDSNNSILGWIVDLRENTGGNMYPMIAGVGPLVGEGTLGNFLFPKNNTSYEWYYSDGVVGADHTKILKIKSPYLLKNKVSKIAVLIGHKTASSGEMTAMSFIGKSNVKFFGQKTGGYTTGNSAYKLSDGSYLILATGIATDRNKSKYLNGISPDIFVDESKSENSILTSKKWLLEK